MKYRIYGTSSCSFCDKAKDLLNSKNLEYDFINIQEDEDGFEVFVKMGYRTVPQIIDPNGQFIGGYDKLVQSFKG